MANITDILVVLSAQYVNLNRMSFSIRQHWIYRILLLGFVHRMVTQAIDFETKDY